AGNQAPNTTIDEGFSVTAGRNLTVDHNSVLGNNISAGVFLNGDVVMAGSNIVIDNGSFVGDLSISSVSLIAGTAAPGNISILGASVIETRGGAIALTTSAGGTLTLSGGSSIVSSGNSGGGAITLQADDMVFDTSSSPASTISASSTGRVSLKQAS